MTGPGHADLAGAELERVVRRWQQLPLDRALPAVPGVARVVGLVEPAYVIPMHYGMPSVNLDLEPVDKFLKAMGVTTVHETDVLKVSGSEFPEQSQVVLLKQQVQAAQA